MNMISGMNIHSFITGSTGEHHHVANATPKMRIPQPRIIVFAVAIYCLLIWRLGHVRAVCSVNLHILHLRGTCCGRSAATSTTSAAPFWAVYIRKAPSTPNRTPPLAIYVRFFTLFLF